MSSESGQIMVGPVKGGPPGSSWIGHSESSLQMGLSKFPQILASFTCYYNAGFNSYSYCKTAGFQEDCRGGDRVMGIRQIETPHSSLFLPTLSHSS